MNTHTRPTVTKEDLREGGLVRIDEIERDTPIGKVVYPAGVYAVKDLMTRKQYNKPNRIGIGPVDRGVAFGVSLAEVVEAIR